MLLEGSSKRSGTQEISCGNDQYPAAPEDMVSQVSVRQRARYRFSLVGHDVKIPLTISGSLLCLPCPLHCPPSTLWEEVLG